MRGLAGNVRRRESFAPDAGSRSRRTSRPHTLVTRQKIRWITRLGVACRMPPRRIVGEELSPLKVQLMVAGDLVFIHVDAQSASQGCSPIGAGGNRERLFQYVVLHHMSGVLIAVDDIGQREQ